ncbi:Metallo-dependent phosphatase, partial [Ophiobolus disseminans]
PISAPLPKSPRIKVVCISDTHTAQSAVPTADILIHAGDLTINGTFAELQKQLHWLSTLAHAHKIVVAGNHDILLDSTYFSHKNPKLPLPTTSPARLDWGSVTYLQNPSATLDIRDRAIRVYGSPMTPEYGNWAFQYGREDVWSGSVPDGTVILVTHGPARGHVDGASPAAGCGYLLREVRRVMPALHVCGHIHRARGKEVVDWNLVQWAYDRVTMGEGGLGTVVVMLIAWIWGWVVYVGCGKRVGQTVFVNAAVEGNEGEDVIVVEV